MKYFIAIFALIAVAAAADEAYPTKYDNIDLDSILESDRLFSNYFKCLLDEGKCTPDGNELKRSLPDALLTECSKCSEKQKDGTTRVIKFLIEKKPAQWEALQAKYDPKRVYETKYKADAEKLGVAL